jgi:hypothetical protein
MILTFFTAKPHVMTEQTAIDAVRAAKGRKSWGRFMAAAFCVKRNVPHGLYRLACQLEAAQKAGF